MLWWFIVVWLASGFVIPVLCLISMARRGVFLRDVDAERRQTAGEPHSAARVASGARAKWGASWPASSLGMWVFRLTEHRPIGGRMTPEVGHAGLYVISGLVSLGVLILLFGGSFGDPNTTMRDQPSASAVADTPVTSAAAAGARLNQSRASAALSPSPVQLSAKPGPDAIDGEEGTVGRGLLPERTSLGGAEHLASIQPRTGDVGKSAGDYASRPTDTAAPQVPAVGVLPTAPVYTKPPVADRGWGHRRPSGTSVRSYSTRSSRGTWLSAPAMNAGANS
jgi:hypothetical protein